MKNLKYIFVVGMLAVTSCGHKESIQMGSPTLPPANQANSIMDSVVLQPGAVYNGCNVTTAVQVNAGWDVDPRYCSGQTPTLTPGVSSTQIPTLTPGVSSTQNQTQESKGRRN